VKELMLFDSNCFLGRFCTPQPEAPHDVPGLLQRMDDLGIAEALVTSPLGVYYNPEIGNETLLQMTAQFERLHPCAVLMPEYSEEKDAQRIRRLIENGARAVRLFPKRSAPLRSWSYRSLFHAIAEYRLPTLIDFELEHYSSQLQEIDWDGLTWALQEYSALPIILPRVGLAIDRALLPLMMQHENLYIETSYYMGTGGIERLCEYVGVHRLLFGTGMPRFAPGPAITLLSYSGLSAQEKQLIGGDNLRRLLNEAKVLHTQETA
jgi:predicted TIM-barrel fold metal-dependent hydrolase